MSSNKKKISCIPLALLVMVMYAIQILFYLETYKNIDCFMPIITLILVSIIMIIINIIYGFISIKKAKDVEKYDLKDFAKKTLIAKLVLIPFYIINFALGVILIMGTLVVPGVIIVGLIPILLGCIWTYALIIATSSYSIVAISCTYGKDKTKTGKLVLNIILQLFYVLDVVSYVIFYIKNKNKM